MKAPRPAARSSTTVPAAGAIRRIAVPAKPASCEHLQANPGHLLLLTLTCENPFGTFRFGKIARDSHGSGGNATRWIGVVFPARSVAVNSRICGSSRSALVNGS
ncbi:hypothetical protein SAMN02787118_105313 [Streptomyces mirabilis]|uniref:Uncharacterized protein n=1 Tax=Streptomyces mirabilis TaxID=68239 RepID=A0A1I2HQX7_9ACTN|nr:hypothetical protein SAMN02787118_105313 [Streptomyces mirabilis]